MTNGNKKLLLAILAIAIAVATYMYVYTPTMQDIETLESDITSLEKKLKDLREKDKNRDDYLAKTDEYNQKFDELVAYFPADLNQEVSVMFMKGMVEAFDFDINSVGLGLPTEMYVLGGGTATDDSYVCYNSAFPISYEGTYEGIQDIMEYIMNYKYRMNISNVSIAYDEENQMCTGSISMNAYCITGPDRTGDSIDVDVDHGVSNLFTGGAGAPAQSKSSKYDADNGDAIATAYNVIMMLNSNANDAASGIIVADSENSTESYVTDNNNEVADVTVSVYTENDKNFVKYEIGDNSYEFELLTQDLTIYVKSSERVDAEDTNGVKVSVDNDTNIPVFFKVDGDDSTSPRFKVGSKSGVVKVY